MKLLLVDDHALFREGICIVLSKMEEISEVVQQATGSGALSAAEDDDDLDIVLLDYQLEDMNGLEVLAGLKSQRPEVPVIMLSAHEQSDLIQNALASNASGFITKTSTSEVMISAIQLVLAGGIYVPPAILADSKPRAPRPFSSQSYAHQGTQRDYQLTARQQDVIQEMGKGLSNKEIARELDMSPSTVKVHVAAILKEFEVKNRTQAVSTAKQTGLID